MSMARDKLLASEPCHVRLICHPHIAGWTRSVLLAISDASEGKLSGPGPPWSRPIHTNGSARFRRWKLYGEEGLARKSTVIWLYGDTLTLEYADTPLTQFTVHFQPDNKHFQQVMDSRQFETLYQSLQGHLWEPDVVEWRMAQRLPDYAPRKHRKRVLGYRQPCLMDDPQTEQG
jgi:hypothetical protein